MDNETNYIEEQVLVCESVDELLQRVAYARSDHPGHRTVIGLLRAGRSARAGRRAGRTENAL